MSAVPLVLEAGAHARNNVERKGYQEEGDDNLEDEESTHDEGGEDGLEAVHVRGVKSVDTCNVACAKERQHSYKEECKDDCECHHFSKNTKQPFHCE